MKLLVVTQAVDVEDPVLGFFVRWIEEFAKHAENIEVICLREGAHALPANVRAHSLGKSSFAKAQQGIGTRLRYVFRFLSLVWRLRRDYDAVFVHMNPEYIVLGGLFWRLLHKRIALWYTHKSVDLKLCVAELLSNIIFTASKESFRLKSRKVRVIGHGIDTVFFTPDPSVARGDWLLSVGRLMPSKRHDLAIRAAAGDGKELRIVGDGPEWNHLEALTQELGARVQFLGSLDQSKLRDEYRRAAFLIHTSETGSLDKVVLEALACGLPVRTNDPALKALESETFAYVRKYHSLGRLIPAMLQIFQMP
ncbi:MAG: Glycosyltransferase [Parcubacteria group bacterium GW2011_GWB1_57_6]|nr:MAG: Glycosyltransferase [Parcubacteria group bacterium GW2011_GWB1_57_6]